MPSQPHMDGRYPPLALKASITLRGAGGKEEKKKEKHTTAGIRWWSPTQLLASRRVAYLRSIARWCDGHCFIAGLTSCFPFLPVALSLCFDSVLDHHCLANKDDKLVNSVRVGERTEDRSQDLYLEIGSSTI